MDERVSGSQESIRKTQDGAAFVFADRVIATVNRTNTGTEIVVASGLKPMAG